VLTSRLVSSSGMLVPVGMPPTMEDARLLARSTSLLAPCFSIAYSGLQTLIEYSSPLLMRFGGYQCFVGTADGTTGTYMHQRRLNTTLLGAGSGHYCLIFKAQTQCDSAARLRCEILEH